MSEQFSSAPEVTQEQPRSRRFPLWALRPVLALITTGLLFAAYSLNPYPVLRMELATFHLPKQFAVRSTEDHSVCAFTCFEVTRYWLTKTPMPAACDIVMPRFRRWVDKGSFSESPTRHSFGNTTCSADGKWHGHVVNMAVSDDWISQPLGLEKVNGATTVSISINQRLGPDSGDYIGVLFAPVITAVLFSMEYLWRRVRRRHRGGKAAEHQ